MYIIGFYAFSGWGLFLFLPSACTSCFYSFLQHVLLVFIPSFSMHFLFLFRVTAYASCFLSFLQHTLLVFIPSFCAYFLFLLRPSACISWFYYVLGMYLSAIKSAWSDCLAGPGTYYFNFNGHFTFRVKFC